MSFTMCCPFDVCCTIRPNSEKKRKGVILLTAPNKGYSRPIVFCIHLLPPKPVTNSWCVSACIPSSHCSLMMEATGVGEA